MLDRLSANALLKSVIAVVAAIAVVLLGLNAWGSWQRLSSTGRIEGVVAASAAAFTAMHNLRVDRA